MLKKINKRKAKQIIEYGIGSHIFLLAGCMIALNALGIGLLWVFALYPATLAFGIFYGLLSAPALPELKSNDFLELKSAQLDEENEKINEKIMYIEKYGEHWDAPAEIYLEKIPKLKKATRILSDKLIKRIYRTK